jgi:hypothetical protein
VAVSADNSGFLWGKTEGYRRRIRDPEDFCRKTPGDFGVEVYRNPTGVSGLGKSAAKELPMECVGQVPLAQPGTRPQCRCPEAHLRAILSEADCAFTHLSDPTTLTATSEKETRKGFPSAVPE